MTGLHCRIFIDSLSRFLIHLEGRQHNERFFWSLQIPWPTLWSYFLVIFMFIGRREKALEMGVPDEDILLEESSKSTKENIIFALQVLERTFKLSNINKILMVTTNYHMRRCLFMAQTYIPGWIKSCPCPADDINTQRYNWYKNEKGYQRAIEEAWKLVNYINEKSIPDFEI